MPKQKQKQKQSQKTSVVVNVGTSKKSRSSRPKSAPAPMQKNPQSISVILQGSSMNLPAPLTNDYNRMMQELDYMRRQQAASGSLIPQMARNDLLNRVQATNPFTARSTNLQAEMLNPYEGRMEEQVERLTTPNAYANNPVATAEIPIDQDFIRRARIERLGQNLGSWTNKIAVVEDAETISDLTAYDDEDLENRLARSVATSKATKGSSRGQDTTSDSSVGATKGSSNKKESALAATSKLIYDVGMMTPKPKKIVMQPEGNEYELKRLEAIKKEKQRQYNKTYREKQKAGK